MGGPFDPTRTGSPAASHRLPPGLLLAGRYRIERFIGQGGMGEVYGAEDLELRARVALKTIRPEIARDPRTIERFRREISLARRVTHPNVARVFDIGHDSMQPMEDTEGRWAEITFLTMELLSGETLAERLRRTGRMSVEEALPLVEQMAAALAAAHGVGIVHRDFKSPNVMLVPTKAATRAVVTDFGLARSAETDAASLTLTGTILGSPEYMSPEQVEGRPVTEASDIYSLGIVLYEMVTGAKPFTGDSPLSIAVKRLTEAPPSPRRHVPDLDPTWETVILRCLERDPFDRFAAAQDVARALGGAILARGKRASPEKARGRLLYALVGAGVLLLLAVAGVYRSLPGRDATRDSLAVLPFVNAGADPDAEYLSEGITDSLIDLLSQLPGLRVMSRNSVFRFKGLETDAQLAGRDLKVGSVLTGRVMPRGENLSVSMELVDVRSNGHLWGGQYIRKMADVLAMQEEIAKQIVDRLHLTLTGKDQARLAKRPTENPEAYQLYLKGRYFSRRWTAEGFRKGIGYLNQAIEADPSYALAYAGLAACYYDSSGLYYPPSEAMPKSKAAAQQALKLDGALAEAHTSLALVLAQYEWNWAEAEKEYKRAIELNPNDAASHENYGNCLAETGRQQEALVEITKASDLDPLSPHIGTFRGWSLYVDRRSDEAIEQLEKVIEMDPSFVPAHYTLGLVLEERGEIPEAIAKYDQAKRLDPEGHFYLVLLGHATAVLGKREEALRIIGELKERAKETYVDPCYIAEIYAGLGENDQAFAWLEKAYEVRSEELLTLRIDPRFEGLRKDTRFAEFFRRMGLSP